MKKIDLKTLEEKYFNTKAKIKKIPRYEDDRIIDLVDVFEYIDKITKNTTPGPIIKDFLIRNNLVDDMQKAVLQRLAQSKNCVTFGYLRELQRIGSQENTPEYTAEKRSKMSLVDKVEEFFQDMKENISSGVIFFWILLLLSCAGIATCVNNSMETEYNDPACAKLGLKSNWNNTKCY